MAFLNTGTMVVCLKHVGVTDGVRERLKMSVKGLASWSVLALSTHPSNLAILTCFKVGLGDMAKISYHGI